MTPPIPILGPAGFAAVVWGTVLLVCVVFAYLVYVLAVDAEVAGRHRR